MPRSSNLKSILAFVFGLPLFGTGSIQPVSPVTVHEWGTFTSVAGPDGESVPWAPLRAAGDLPCFVHSIGPAKYWPGLIRMETPVDYFYTQSPARVSVHVDFPEGTVTEWYPRAAQADHSIEWNDLTILPGANLVLPSSKGASRYYAARATDSAELQSGDENEKVLFYRGMGNLKVPLEPVSQGSGVVLRNNSAETIPFVMLFENQNGRIGYRIIRDLKAGISLKGPGLNASFENLQSDLTYALEQSGLYPKEAAAMIETWHDSWFEEGTRLIYLMPRVTVDKVLPLTVTPAPKEIQRVFVGRVEILSPSTETAIRAAMESNDTQKLDRYERFLAPFLAQIRAKGGLTESPLATKYALQAASRIDSAPCIQ